MRFYGLFGTYITKIAKATNVHVHELQRRLCVFFFGSFFGIYKGACVKDGTFCYVGDDLSMLLLDRVIHALCTRDLYCVSMFFANDQDIVFRGDQGGGYVYGAIEYIMGHTRQVDREIGCTRTSV